MSVFVLITIGLVLTKVYCMVNNKMPTDVLGLFIIAVVLVTFTLPMEDTISCFSSTSVILVGVLSVLAAGLVHSGVLQWIVKTVLRSPSSYSRALLRIYLPAALMSAFINNLAVVQLFVSAVKMWSRRLGIAPSKLLLPLSYASTIGGLCTIIGSTPNLLLAEFYTRATGESMGIFAPLLPGLFCLVVSYVSISFLSGLIPARKSPEESFESSSEYTVEMLVPTDFAHVGDTVTEADLYSVRGGQLIEIVRFDHEVISPVPKDEFILGGDRLVYSGNIASLMELRETHGLVSATHHVFSVNEIKRHRKLQMATVDADSPLVGTAMVDNGFEDHNDVVLVAVAREGERLTDEPRNVVLRAGDTLLMEGAKMLPEHYENSLNFFDSITLPQNGGYKTYLSSIIMIGMVLLSVFKVMPLLHSCFLATLIMGLTRCISVAQLQKAINWKLLAVFAGSVCLGRAIEATGLARYSAEAIQLVCDRNVWLSLLLICAVTTVVTEFISNTTAAAVFAPIALHVATSLNANPMTFIIALMTSASCSFATPIGSDTNTLVYGPGGFRFTDYLPIGICLNIIMLAANLFIVNIVYPLY